MFCKKANEVGLNQIVALPGHNSRCKNWIKIYRIGPNENSGRKFRVNRLNVMKIIKKNLKFSKRLHI